jgi:hypothetical protein
MLPKNRIEITLGGEPRALHFGMGFVGELLEGTGKDLSEIGEALAKNPYKWAPEIIHRAMAYASQRDKKEFGVSLQEVTDWIDDEGGITSQVIEDSMKAFNDSLFKGTAGIAEQTADPYKSGRKLPAKKK